MMQTAFGLHIPMTLEDVCNPQTMALLVYDMQVGIAQHLPDSSPFGVAESDYEFAPQPPNYGGLPNLKVPQNWGI